jgi:hypothetical protein
LYGWCIGANNGDFRPKMTYSWIVKAKIYMKGYFTAPHTSVKDLGSYVPSTVTLLCLGIVSRAKRTERAHESTVKQGKRMCNDVPETRKKAP